MNAENEHPARSLSRSWIRATTLGWLIGFVLVVVLAVIWDLIGGGAQFMVGVGMGAGVGYMQSREVRSWTRRLQPWLWASTIGMGTPFVLWDISSAIGVEVFLSLPVCVLLGGLFTGVLQYRMLRPRFERTAWWIPACVVGWGLPAGVLALVDAGGLPPVFSMLSPIVMFLGGLLLGAVTGRALQWMSPDERSHRRIQTTGFAGG